MARTQANDVRDLLVRLDTCLTAKEIAFELSKSGVQIGNVRYAAQEAVHRFPGEIATDVHEGRSVFGPTAKVRQLTARLPRQSPT